MKNYKILKRGSTHTLVKGPMNYYLYVPNEEFKEDDSLLDKFWSAGIYLVDVESLLIKLIV